MKKFEINTTFLTQIGLTILIFNILMLAVFSPLIFKFLTKTETETSNQTETPIESSTISETLNQTSTISETLNQTSTIETLNQTSTTETQNESSPNPQTFTTTETSNETANSTHF